MKRLFGLIVVTAAITHSPYGHGVGAPARAGGPPAAIGPGVAHGEMDAHARSLRTDTNLADTGNHSLVRAIDVTSDDLRI